MSFVEWCVEFTTVPFLNLWLIKDPYLSTETRIIELKNNFNV